MKIVVCVKQVPDTTEIKIDPVKKTLIREGVPSIMNPDDKAGLEFALQLKDKYGAEVTCLSMGPMQAGETLREAMAMGADRAILLSGREFAGSDTLATSTALVGVLSQLEADLIIMGRQAIDGDTAQVGPETAELLGLPQISYASSVEFDGSKFIVERKVEDRTYVLSVKGPAVITVLGDSVQPRYMTVSGILSAWREKEVEVWGVDKCSYNMAELGLKGSPTKVSQSFTKEVKAAGVVHENLDAAEAAKLIVATLKEKHMI